jgi:DNA repair protein RadC
VYTEEVEQLPLLLPEHPDEPRHEPKTTPDRPQKRRRVSSGDDERRRNLREALAAYNLDLRKLRRLASDGQRVNEVLQGIHGDIPPELISLLDILSALLQPLQREQIESPGDVANLLMVEMGHLMQEELRVICLNTKNYIQLIHTVYKGSVNSAAIRVTEIFREPVRLNSTSIVVVHNHPSGNVDPSPEDVAVTRAIVSAGELLDIQVLDHVIVAQGKWLSMKERRLGFI